MKKEHLNGPLSTQCKNWRCRQYMEAHQPSGFLSLSNGDNCVQVGEQIGLVKNFIVN